MSQSPPGKTGTTHGSGPPMQALFSAQPSVGGARILEVPDDPDAEQDREGEARPVVASGSPAAIEAIAIAMIATIPNRK